MVSISVAIHRFEIQFACMLNECLKISNLWRLRIDIKKIIIVIILYFYKVSQSALYIAAIKRSPVN